MGVKPQLFDLTGTSSAPTTPPLPRTASPKVEDRGSGGETSISEISFRHGAFSIDDGLKGAGPCEGFCGHCRRGACTALLHSDSHAQFLSPLRPLTHQNPPLERGSRLNATENVRPTGGGASAARGQG
ncbi:hypothetical protein JCM6882_001734 [Rhodosporidiobolus microsporus]